VKTKAISISRLTEIIDLCKEKGVSKISIPDSIELEFFPFAMNLGSIPAEQGNDILAGMGHNSDEDDMSLLLHSAT